MVIDPSARLKDLTPSVHSYLVRVRGSNFRYLSPGNRECDFELRQRLQSVVECTINVRNITNDGPVRPSDVSLIFR